jgi:hypothetical protein
MVALSPEVEAALQEVIDERTRAKLREVLQDRDGRPRREVLACDVGRRGLDLDRLPRRRPEDVPLIDGRPCEWTEKDAPGVPCPVCKGRPGTSRCLKCTASAYDATHEYAGVKSDVGGPTVYGGTGGLKGGVGA